MGSRAGSILGGQELLTAEGRRKNAEIAEIAEKTKRDRQVEAVPFPMGFEI
jgi:hypothetical protein